jgi:phospholipid/cholesterol/gamma-HCH transport system substrate-binding protein
VNPNQGRRLSNFQIGLIAVVITFFGFYLAFTKSIPFVSGGGYELKAVFQDAQNLRVKSPVRVSGVDVGKVTQVEHLADANGEGEDAALVTMTLQDKALPIHEDARLALRPRLFLEGNLFVEVNPGSPSAPELHSGSTVPDDQTAISVQFDQVLTSLQAPVRTDLQIFLKEFGDALDKYGGAEGFRESFRTSPAAYRYTSEVNEALLGRQPGDLAGFIHNFDTVIAELDANRTDLQGLITNFAAVSGSFAANQSSLRQAIIELPQVLAIGRPTLAKLNRDFPALRAFAREALPGTKAANKALDYANPWIGQMRQLVSKDELRGLIKDLRPTIPDLANLANASLPFLEQSRLFASCFNNVVIPWSNTPIPNNDSDPPAAKVYQETGYGLTGVAGESRSGDANGQEFRVLAGGGPNTIGPITSGDPAGGELFGVAPFHIIGAEPAKQSSRKTPYHPEVPCETQEAPNLNTFIATPPPQTASASAASPDLPADTQAMVDEFRKANQLFEQARSASAKGNDAEAKSLQQQAEQVMQQYGEDWAAWRKAHPVGQGGGG